jgi:hypothetical protein
MNKCLNMKYKILLTVILFMACQISWSADQKEKKGDDKTQLVSPNQAEGVVYSLPRTVLTIQVKVISETFRPGPYAQFAEKYLGYQDVKTTSSETWKIVGMSVSSQGEADPDAVFKTFGPSATMISLYPDGSIAGINNTGVIENLPLYGNDNIAYTPIPPILFPDMSSEDQYDVEVNSATGEEKIKFKTLEDKAREAADFLFRLRQKRAFTTMSPSDRIPEDGKAFEVFVQQVDKIEKEYLSLFLGKTFQSEQVVTVPFIPGSESTKSEVLFRFSDEKGIVPKTDISGKPVLIDVIKDQKQFTSIESIYQPTNQNSGRSGLFYRIPVNASLTISEGFNVLFSGRMPIAQFGLISPVPELLINDNTTVTFDRVTGTITHSGKNK